MQKTKWTFVAAVISLLSSPVIYIAADGWRAVYSGFFFMLLGIVLLWNATKARNEAEN